MARALPAYFQGNICLYFRPHVHTSVRQSDVKCNVTTITKNNRVHHNNSTTKNSAIKEETSVDYLLSDLF